MKKIKITVDNGKIVAVDDRELIDSLAKTWAETIPGNWSTKQLTCLTALREITGYPDACDYLGGCEEFRLYDPCKVASEEYCMEISEKIRTIYDRFITKITPINVLNDGEYEF